MKPLPPHYVPGKTEAERMDNAVRRVFTASKESLPKREAEQADLKGPRREKGLGDRIKFPPSSPQQRENEINSSGRRRPRSLSGGH